MAEGEIVYRCCYENTKGKILDVCIEGYNIYIPEPSIIITKEEYDYIKSNFAFINDYKRIENGVLRDATLEEKLDVYIDFWNNMFAIEEVFHCLIIESYKNLNISIILYEFLKSIDTSALDNARNFILTYENSLSLATSIVNTYKNYDFNQGDIQVYKEESENWKNRVFKAYQSQ